jgi:hypothetical protein
MLLVVLNSRAAADTLRSCMLLQPLKQHPRALAVPATGHYQLAE